jgi:hypothetical protein
MESGSSGNCSVEFGSRGTSSMEFVLKGTCSMQFGLVWWRLFSRLYTLLCLMRILAACSAKKKKKKKKKKNPIFNYVLLLFTLFCI